MKIKICVPVYNEEDSLPKFLDQLEHFIQNFNKKKIELSVLFYDDGSTDNSLKLLNGSNFTVINEMNNKGLGYAIGKLFNYAFTEGVDGVVKLDCDGQMSINEIGLFIDVAINENVDLIQGSRFKKSVNFKLGISKKLGIKFFRHIFKIIGIEVQDSSNGFIYVSKKWLEDHKIIGNYNAAQQILLDTKLRNLEYRQIDVTIENRDFGKSFIGIKYPFNVLSSMILLALYRKTSKLIIIPGLIFLMASIILFFNDLILWLQQSESKIISNQVTIFTTFLGINLTSTGFLIEFLKKQKII